MFSEDYYSLDRFDLCLCTSPRTQPHQLLQGHFNRMGIENRIARQAMCFSMFIYTSHFFFFFCPPLVIETKLVFAVVSSQGVGKFKLQDSLRLVSFSTD